MIQFNRSKYRKYQDICFDIQKTYGIDDYVDLLWNFDNMCRTLDNSEEAINELSDTELAEVEQVLLSTAQFIGLSEYRSFSGSACSIIEADFNPDYFYNFQFDPLEFIKSTIPNFIPLLPFSWWAPQVQLNYLRDQYREGINATDQKKGTIAADLRSLRGDMKLDGLRSLDPNFMNIELRNFLNINTNGSARYEWDEVRTKPWREVISFGSQKHQSTAPNTRVVIWNLNVYLTLEKRWVRIPIYAYNRLNAKFCHPDGREAVFSYVSQDRGEFVDQIFDKGTYNYGEDGGNDSVMGITSLPIPFIDTHLRHDMKPFDKWFEDLREEENYAEEIRRLSSENGKDLS
jgi:hypothetical protein